MPDTLFEEIVGIQNRYKILLLSVQEAQDDSQLFLTLDEVAVFWRENLKKVDLFLRHIPKDRMKYFFTGSTFLDVNQYEHYAFASIGAIHIFDDPLPSLIMKDQSIDLSSESQYVANEIKRMVFDDIKILEECSGLILVLPIRMLFDTYEAYNETNFADELFLGLFSDVSTLSSYMSDMKSIQDIEKHLRPEIVNAIIFNPETENSTFQERFRKAREYFDMDFVADKSDAVLFHMIVSGYLDQSYRIIMLSFTYDIIPYLRDPVALLYLVFILSNRKSSKEVDHLTTQSILANIFYNHFNKRNVIEIEFPAYSEVISNTRFAQGLEQILIKYDCINSEEDIIAATSEINNQLRILYADISKLPPTPRTVDPTTPSTDV